MKCKNRRLKKDSAVNKMDKEIRNHVLKGLAKNVRYDGRKATEFRPITIEYNISKSAEGSARVRIGQTEVLVGVKLGVEKPYADTSEQGNLMVNAELLPLSSPKFESGPPGEQAIELARVVDRGIRESHAIDTHKLCITPKEAVWSVMIDVISINDDGDLLDAAGIAALAALRSARFPKYEDKAVDYMMRTDTPLPLSDAEPLLVTVYKIGAHFIVDPIPDEEQVYDARLTVAVTKKGELSALQKGGAGPLSVDDIDKMVALAQEQAGLIRKHFR